MGPYLYRVRRNAPRSFVGPSPPLVSLDLLAAQPLHDKSMLIIDDGRTIMRGWVDPRKKFVIVPGMSGYLKREQDSIFSHGGVALGSEPQPISSKGIWMGSHVVRRGVHTGGHRYGSRVFCAVEIRRIHESEMEPYLTRVRRKFPPLMGLYPLRTSLWFPRFLRCRE